MPDDELAIYNLAGEVRMVPVTVVDFTVDVTRGVSDAYKLNVLRGERDGLALRVSDIGLPSPVPGPGVP